VLFRHKSRAGRRIEDDPATRQSFTKIVVGIPFQFQGDPWGHKSAKTLPSRALKVQVNSVCGQALWAKTPPQLTAQNSADHPMRVANRQGCLDLLTFLQGWLGQIEQ